MTSMFGLTSQQIEILKKQSDKTDFYDLDNKTKAELLTINLYPGLILDINDFLQLCYYSSHSINGEKILPN